MPAYLDCNASTRPLPEVLLAMREFMEQSWANPSSVHREGARARAAIDLAREGVAALLSVEPREVIFTSGGTESANMAIRGVVAHRSGARAVAALPVVISSKLEHSAVRETVEALARIGQVEAHWVGHQPSGEVDYAALERLTASMAGRDVLVSLMWVNNETGVISDIPRCAAICKRTGAILHTDATQAIGKMSVDLRQTGVDMATLSAHKLHGPKGVGALFVRNGLHIEPLITGGPQERGRRAGSENVAAIVGFGVACRLAGDWLRQNRGSQRQQLLESSLCKSLSPAVINGAGAPRLWTTTNIGFANLSAEALVVALSEQGVSVSAGAACSSGSIEASPVLLAMGVPESIAHGSIRLSIDRFTTDEEVLAAVEAIKICVGRMRPTSGGHSLGANPTIRQC